MADQDPKKQIIDKLKDIENVLVTVNTNPSVDELSAALGITLLLNKVGKHATAVFSGDIPPAITFLDPQKTFENTADSLRDFIIALDKEKADHLRYKVDGDMVKIFITPYRTTISDKDLEFSQGDYNVEMVIAIGVKNSDDLDKALADHGKIMHDAAVVSMSLGSDKSDLGTINWHSSEASSYSEMLMSLADMLSDDKNNLDEQIATAFLTGIVAATERFSNNLTTSQSMTMAAQLMAAGANQQLIATKLEEADEIPENVKFDEKPKDLQIENTDVEQPTDSEPKDSSEVVDRQAADGSMMISHEKSGDLDAVSEQTEQEQQAAAAEQATEALNQAAQTTNEAQFAADLQSATMPEASVPTLDDMRHDLETAAPNAVESYQPQDMMTRPSMGGTLNATTEQAAADKLREEQIDKSAPILSHDHQAVQYVGNPPSTLPALNSFGAQANDEPVVADMLSGVPDQPATMQVNDIQPPVDMSGPTLAEIDAQNRGTSLTPAHDEARAAIENAFQTGPSTDDQIATVNSAIAAPATLPEMPPLPISDVPTAVGLPPLPPPPDFSTLPPLPSAAPVIDSLATTVQSDAQTPASNDPATFQIPTPQ